MGNIDNPFIRALSDIGDLIILNALLIVCCLPVFTAGASITAAYKVASLLADHSCGSVVQSFFQSFRDNFKKSSVLWLYSVIIIFLLAVQYIFICSLDGGLLRNVWSALWFVFLFAFFALLTYIFPLIVRYENEISQHIKNSALLSVAHFPRTILLVLLSMLPFALLIFETALFFLSLPFWILIGFAAVIRLNTAILKPVISELDKISEGTNS